MIMSVSQMQQNYLFQFLVLPILIVIVVIFGEECESEEKSKFSNVTYHNNRLTNTKIEGFIVGGSFAEIAQFPHAMCLIQLNKHGNAPHSFCGSSVLNQQVLLTAAHCMEDEMFAYGGHENLDKVTIIRKVDRYYKHENYNCESVQNDIAILFFDNSTIPLGGNSPIKRGIISRNFPLHIDYAEISGWGVVDEVKSSSILKTTKQKVFPLEECEDQYEWLPGMMCAGDLDSDKNRPSRGDSGSGLVAHKHQIIGVVSFTVAAHPGLIIYTNVSDYYDWVVNSASKKICES